MLRGNWDFWVAIFRLTRRPCWSLGLRSRFRRTLACWKVGFLSIDKKINWFAVFWARFLFDAIYNNAANWQRARSSSTWKGDDLRSYKFRLFFAFLRQLFEQKKFYKNAKERDLCRFPRGRHARRVSTTNFRDYSFWNDQTILVAQICAVTFNLFLSASTSTPRSLSSPRPSLMPSPSRATASAINSLNLSYLLNFKLFIYNWFTGNTSDNWKICGTFHSSMAKEKPGILYWFWIFEFIQIAIMEDFRSNYSEVFN